MTTIQNSPYLVLLVIALFGLAMGLCLTIMKGILFLFKNNIIAKNILDFIYTVIFILQFFLCINYFNFGQFRLYLIIIYSLCCFIFYKTFGKVIAKFGHFAYNKFIDTKSKLKNSKIGVLFLK